MCSGSILVTTPIWVGSFKKVPSDSSASTTIHSPLPMRALVPQALMMPPAITVGSRSAAFSKSAISEVVVVLPCVPVIDTVAQGRISSASISARRMIGRPRSLAASNSGLPALTALEMTRWPAPLTLSGSWPIRQVMPRARRRSRLALSFKSLPCT